MEADFWHNRWQNNQIGFHEENGNQFLTAHFHQLALQKGQRIFVPLCGKTRDIHWLLSNGFQVVGVELSELAITQLFNELDITPKISELSKLKHYQAKNIDIFVGDIFELTDAQLGHVNAVFDRAALVALPNDMRKHYSQHLIEITQQAPQLLVTFEYQQDLMAGPPFSIDSEEVKQHYKNDYKILLLDTVPLSGGFKEASKVDEKVWLLK